MCDFCRRGIILTCDWCGKLVCFDYSWGDDLIGAAMTTHDGEAVLCDDCYPSYASDRLEYYQQDVDADYFEFEGDEVKS